MVNNISTDLLITIIFALLLLAIIIPSRRRKKKRKQNYIQNPADTEDRQREKRLARYRPNAKNKGRRSTAYRPASAVSKTEKGTAGEKSVAFELSCLPGKKEIFRNCYFFHADGTTSEIDVIMLHEKGIYVIESKNFSGWIFGNESDPYWTQSLSKGGKAVKNRFYNPILQNKGHISALRKALHPDFIIPITSYIVFGKQADLKSITANSRTAKVITSDKLHGSIVIDLMDKEPAIPDDEFERMAKILRALTQVDDETKRRHVENINANHLYPDT